MDPHAKKIRLTDMQRLVSLLRVYAKPYWKYFLLLLGLKGLETICSLLPPLVMAPILDIVLKRSPAKSTDGSTSLAALDLGNLGQNVLRWLHLDAIENSFHVVLILCGIYLLVGALKNLASFASYLVALWVRMGAARDMQCNLFSHILSLSMDFFHKQRAGELLSRLDRDTTATTYGFESIVGNLIICPSLILVYSIMLLRTAPRLALAVMGGAVLHYALTKFLKKPLRKHLADKFTAFAELRSWVQEAILGIRIVKSFGAEQQEMERLRRAVGDVNRLNVKFAAHKHVERPVRAIVDRSVQVVVLAIAAYYMLEGELEATAFLMFLYVVQALMDPIAKLGTTFTAIQTTLAASERVFELFGEVSTIEDGCNDIKEFREELCVDNVTFAYEEKPTLYQVSLSVRRGNMVALVGPSGAGKSTLADILLRFYDPDQGLVTIDGQDIRQFRQKSYRGLFGVVPQDPMLFNATIAENISYGRQGLSQAQIEKAAQIANAVEFIHELPDSYATLIGDRGIRLSGGQRQRIAIARAIAAEPDILILDEATSALDSESEHLVQQAIDHVIRQTTTIIIAHRLSTVMHADKIFVFERGRIIDHGVHEELLSSCSLYRYLCDLQLHSED